MSDDNPDLKDQIYVALDILKARLKLPSRAAVIEHLINKNDPTVMQIAARRVKLGATKGTAQELEENE